MLDFSLLNTMLSDDKLFEIAEGLPFRSLYQFATVSQRFHGIASGVARIHIRSYFPYLKEEKSEAYQANPLVLFKEEFFHRKNEMEELNLSRKEWLKILSGDLSVIPGKSNAQACYALAYVSGHCEAFAFLESMGQGRAFVLAAKMGRASIIEKLSQATFARVNSFGSLDEKDMTQVSPLLEKVKFFKERVREVPLSASELENYSYFVDNYYRDYFSLGSPHHHHYYHHVTTRFVIVREAICPQLHFEDIAILYALAKGYTESVKILLMHHAQYIHVEIKGLVLEHAALNGDADLVKFILSQEGERISLAGKIVAVDSAKSVCRQIILDEMNHHELFQALYWVELLRRVLRSMKNFCQVKKHHVTLGLTARAHTWFIIPTKSLFFDYSSTPTFTLTNQVQQESVENKSTEPQNVAVKMLNIL